MRKKNVFLALGLLTVGGLLLSCSSSKTMSSRVETVAPFNVDKYVGQWYEIARFDFKFEKDMNNVTANYSVTPEGKIKVINKGFNTKKEKWKEVVGKAKFNGPTDRGALKVSFFGPFYSEYNIVKLSKDYSTALIFGESTDNIWILSREKTISESTKKEYLDFAQQNGYDLSRLVWTVH